jgi:hypothetical protein
VCCCAFSHLLIIGSVARSVHNVRIEQLWCDVRLGALDYWHEVFLHLEHVDELDMEDPVHCLAIIIIFQPRIQATLDEMV